MTLKSSILEKMGRISALQKTRLLNGLNVLCLWRIHLCSNFFSAAKHAMAKLISFTEDFTLKKKDSSMFFNQFESSKALIAVSCRAGRGGRQVGTWM